MKKSGQALSLKRLWYRPLLLARYLLILALLGYVTIALYIFSIQDDLIYAPPKPPIPAAEATKQAAAAGLIPWNDSTPGTNEPQGYVPLNFTAPAPRGTIVFFHGSGDNVWLSADRIAPFSQRGFRVFFYEYPGFGGKPGLPSEKVIVPDAQALVRSLARNGFGPIYVWGESLGTGVAAAVCADKSLPIQGLVLVSPWDNIANVGLSYYPYLPIRPFMTDTYDSIANLEKFHRPVCVIRGDQDDTILPARTLNLYAHLAEPKKMILMKGYGHGDWPSEAGLLWWDEALNFVAPRASQ